MHVGGCQHACTCMHAGNAHACMQANMGLYIVFLIKSRITHILNSENIYTWTQFNHLNLIQLFETQKIIYIELNKEIHNFNRSSSRFYFISRWSNKEEALILIVRSNFNPYKISYTHSLFIMIKGKEGFRHTWFHNERNVEGCMISRTPELREKILLFSHQVLFFILRGDERLPRERLLLWWRENPTHDIYSIKEP